MRGDGGFWVGKRILLVSSEPFISWGVAHVLISEGHHVIVAAEASEALKQVVDGKFDIGLIDACLNGTLDGAALARKCVELVPGMKVFLVAPGKLRGVEKRAAVLRKPKSLCGIRAILRQIDALCGQEGGSAIGGNLA
jgi:DNA-binding response OmpR family regulator